MQKVLHDIKAGRLTDELRRRGISPDQRVGVVVEAVDDGEPPITALNAAGGAFGWLADEPDLYSDDDLVERWFDGRAGADGPIVTTSAIRRR